MAMAMVRWVFSLVFSIKESMQLILSFLIFFPPPVDWHRWWPQWPQWPTIIETNALLMMIKMKPKKKRSQYAVRSFEWYNSFMISIASVLISFYSGQNKADKLSFHQDSLQIKTTVTTTNKIIFLHYLFFGPNKYEKESFEL